MAFGAVIGVVDTVARTRVALIIVIVEGVHRHVRLVRERELVLVARVFYGLRQVDDIGLVESVVPVTFRLKKFLPVGVVLVLIRVFFVFVFVFVIFFDFFIPVLFFHFSFLDLCCVFLGSVAFASLSFLVALISLAFDFGELVFSL